MNSPPIYNPKESINVYIEKSELYIMGMQQEKYLVILDFINDWLKIKLKSLTEFNNMKKQTLLKNRIHNNNVMKTHIPIFNYTFNIELNVKIKNIDDGIVDDKYIINLLKYMLKMLKLHYKLIKMIKYDVVVYSIKKKG